MAEARGSSPLSSTSSSSLEPAPISVGSNPFRDRLGYWMDVVAAGQEVIVTRRGRPRLRLTAAAQGPLTDPAGGTALSHPPVISV